VKLQLEGIPQRKEGFRLEVLDQEILLLHPVDGQIVQCNSAAGTVWQLCDGARTIAEIVELLRDAYPESAESIETDVLAILEELRTADVISIH
jgi:coenzyme PQQ biosynthesis protein PqqD